MTKIGLYFGSFNPIHVGHLIIANTMVERGGLDQVWFVVSPQNPLKVRKSLAHEFDRMDMVQAAIFDNYNFKASDVEFAMPRPSFTIDTLTYLSEKHPEKQFLLILGQDNLQHFHKWKNDQEILKNYELLVYPRPDCQPSPLDEHPKISFVEAPLLDISATFIRENIKNGKSVRYLLPDTVIDIIVGKKLYQ